MAPVITLAQVNAGARDGHAALCLPPARAMIVKDLHEINCKSFAKGKSFAIMKPSRSNIS